MKSPVNDEFAPHFLVQAMSMHLIRVGVNTLYDLLHSMSGRPVDYVDRRDLLSIDTQLRTITRALKVKNVDGGVKTALTEPVEKLSEIMENTVRKGWSQYPDIIDQKSLLDTMRALVVTMKDGLPERPVRRRRAGLSS